MPPIITDLIPVPVHGHTLFVANGDLPMVPLRPICDALGVSWQMQHRKVTTHPTFSPCVITMMTHDASGRMQEMTCMPADLVMGWLLTIHPDRVAARVRDTLIAFQRTAARLLHDAWAAMRAGLPFTGGAALASPLAQAPVSAWLAHPAVQDAVLMRRRAQDIRAEAGAQSRVLLRESTRRVKRLGLRAAHLALLVEATTLPALPAQPDLPLLGEG